MNRFDDALNAYAQLAAVDDVRVAGLPAELVARRARCAVLEEAGRAPELLRDARALGGDLLAGRWRVDRGTFTSYRDEINRWLGADMAIDREREALSEAVDWVWSRWNGASGTEFRATGRRAARFAGTGLTLLWQPAGDRLNVLVAGPRFQRREWFDAPTSTVDARGFTVALLDGDGQSVSGAVNIVNPSAVVRRAASATQLPWTVLVTTAAAAGTPGELAARRRLLLAGLALLVGLVLAGGYFVVRAISRELAVAQLQSDFVAAVSHEFRTPLTSLRQFTDLLNDKPDAPAAKRQSFYEAQARATERLRRLVESLLDFGRMEAGARPYRLEPRAIAPLVAGIVDDFRRDAMPQGFTIDVSSGADGALVRVDADAFTLALWNLLDNAVKYSGASRLVAVAVNAQNGTAIVRVRDQGFGISRREQRDIFEKFMRGTASREHGISGTGIGLAMVRHIVDAHGGVVTVESTPGAGSTFEIALPTEPSCRES
jgi:signal transduction histidine kinase